MRVTAISAAGFLVGLWLAAGSASAQDEGEPATEAETADSLKLEPSFGIGLGVTQRLIEFGGREGTRRLDTGWIPALSLGTGVQLSQGDWQLSAAVHYQTSLHATGVQYTPDPASPALTTPLRTHRVELGLQPGLRLGASASVALFVGYGLRALASVAELRVPRYTLHGPVLRPELELSMFEGRLRLRIAPEAGLIVSMTRDLRRESGNGPPAYSLGGQASLSYRLAAWLTIALNYREAHAWAKRPTAERFSDVERFGLLDGSVAF
jgi:hypothetical protein